MSSSYKKSLSFHLLCLGMSSAASSLSVFLSAIVDSIQKVFISQISFSFSLMLLLAQNFEICTWNVVFFSLFCTTVIICKNCYYYYFLQTYMPGNSEFESYPQPLGLTCFAWVWKDVWKHLLLPAELCEKTEQVRWT